MRAVFAIVLVAPLLLGQAGCGPRATTIMTGTPSPKEHGSQQADTTKVTAFSVDIENLNVDKITMRDGGFVPDGNRDLVFRATVEGPADALYLVTTSPQGQPHYGFRADTISGQEELPSELGSVVDIGHLTTWIAVVEGGKFINRDGGALGDLPAGTHNLKLYVPNTGNLRPGSHLRLYARAPSGRLAAGPVVPY